MKTNAALSPLADALEMVIADTAPDGQRWWRVKLIAEQLRLREAHAAPETQDWTFTREDYEREALLHFGFTGVRKEQEDRIAAMLHEAARHVVGRT